MIGLVFWCQPYSIVLFDMVIVSKFKLCVFYKSIFILLSNNESYKYYCSIILTHDRMLSFYANF
jgi:hypothetical protein